MFFRKKCSFTYSAKIRFFNDNSFKMLKFLRNKTMNEVQIWVAKIAVITMITTLVSLN